MSKVVINVKSSDIGNFKDNDLLVFDKENNIFYKTTYEEFWGKHHAELQEIIKRYDAVVEEFKQQAIENENKYNDLVERLNEKLDVYLTQINKNNKALIEMVRNFIENGGNI